MGARYGNVCRVEIIFFVSKVAGIVFCLCGVCPLGFNISVCSGCVLDSCFLTHSANTDMHSFGQDEFIFVCVCVFILTFLR